MVENSKKDLEEDEKVQEDILEEIEDKADNEAICYEEPIIVSDEEESSEIDPDKMGAEGAEFKLLTERKSKLLKTAEILAIHDVVVQKLINKARDDLVWEQYMKCDGLPDPVCVRELNTYFALWKGDTREEIDAVSYQSIDGRGLQIRSVTL